MIVSTTYSKSDSIDVQYTKEACMIMRREILKSRIQKLQEELNALAEQDSGITDKDILHLSMRLDDLIVEFHKQPVS
jgi:hypothetical protein